MKRLLIVILVSLLIPSAGVCLSQAEYSRLFDNVFKSFYQYNDSYQDFDRSINTFKDNITLLTNQRGGPEILVSVALFNSARESMYFSRGMLHQISQEIVEWDKIESTEVSSAIIFTTLSLLAKCILYEQAMIQTLNEKVNRLNVLTNDKRVLYLVRQFNNIVYSEMTMSQGFQKAQKEFIDATK